MANKTGIQLKIHHLEKNADRHKESQDTLQNKSLLLVKNLETNVSLLKIEKQTEKTKGIRKNVGTQKIALIQKDLIQKVVLDQKENRAQQKADRIQKDLIRKVVLDQKENREQQKADRIQKDLIQKVVLDQKENQAQEIQVGDPNPACSIVCI